MIVEETARPEYEHYAGLTVQDIADREGKHVIDALLDLVVADDLGTEFIAAAQGRDVAQYTAEVLDSPHIVAGYQTAGRTLNSGPPEITRRICLPGWCETRR